jgi:membrane protease YdiL (CAAX protease family)
MAVGGTAPASSGLFSPVQIVLVYLAVAAGKPLVLDRSGVWFWAWDAVFYVLVPLLLWCLAQPTARSVRLGPNTTQPAEMLIQALVCWVLLEVVEGRVWVWVMELQAWSKRPDSGWPWPAVDYGASMGTGLRRVALGLYGAISGALVEEWVFRVLMLRVALARGWRAPSYVLISSMAFALAHVGPGPGVMLFAACCGVVLATLFWRTLAFWPLVAAHAGFNLLTWQVFG